VLLLSACDAHHDDAAGDNVFKEHSHTSGACGLRKTGKSRLSHDHGARSCANHSHDGAGDHTHSKKKKMCKKECSKSKESCACKAKKKHKHSHDDHGHSH